MFGVSDEFRRTQLAIAALFCFLGFQYATWASRLPAIRSRLDLSTAQLGLLLLATGVGAAGSYPLVAMLMRRLGSRRLAYLSTVALCLILLAMATTPGYTGTLVIMCCDGVAVACLNVAMNTQGAALEAAYRRTSMAKLHATFSGGTFAGALLASGVSAVTPTLSVHFGVATVLLLVLVATTRSRLLAADPPAPVRAPGRRRWTMPSRMTLWLGGAMVFGTVTEGAMNDWSALYMRDVVHAGAELAPMGIAVVSASMVLARLFADGWRTRWGDRRVVLVGATLAGCALAAALLLGGVAPALVGFACVGLGIAAVTPCVYVAAARQGSTALTLVATMGVTGLLAGPPTIGFVANAGGLAWGLGVVAVAAILVSVCATRVRWPAAPTEVVEPDGLTQAA